MTTTVRRPEILGATGIVAAAAEPISEVLARLDTIPGEGLSGDEVARRQSTFGPNAVASHRAQPWAVLWHQLKSPLLGLLLVAAVASSFVGEGNDAVIIAIIVAASVGLGFVNEFRSAKAAQALHSQIHHEAVVVRNGRSQPVDVTELVPGDIVRVRLGDIVPADLAMTWARC